jgi:3-oxoacyl-[acyl-carrier-protein] synthase II
MTGKRVAVTGMGVVSPLGLDVATTMAALYAGRSGVGRIQRFDPAAWSTQIAAEVLDFDPTRYMDKKDAKRADRFAQFAIAASQEAVAQAKLAGSDVDPERIAVIIGSGIGGMETFEIQHQALLEKGPSRVSPFFVPMMITDMASGLVSMQFGFKGPNYCAVSACASAANAIATGYLLIRAGLADAVVTGGAEATVTPMTMAGFCSLKAMSERNDDPATASRPFDLGRDGFVLGEGTGIVILEDLDVARRRGAKVLGLLTGIGMTGDAYHMTAPAPDGEGATRAMRAALDCAGCAPEDVQYINAHGTSTPYNDRNETQAIKTVFGAHASRLKVSSTKSMTGHLLGASGGLEAVVCIDVLASGRIPPTINQFERDPECDLDYVPNHAVQAHVRRALSNSFGFGGHNVSLLFEADAG